MTRTPAPAARPLTPFQEAVLDQVTAAARWYALQKATVATADDIAYAMSKPTSTIARALNRLEEAGLVRASSVAGLDVPGYAVVSPEAATAEPEQVEEPAAPAETPEQAVTRRLATYARQAVEAAAPSEVGSTFLVETDGSGSVVIIRERDPKGLAVGTVTMTAYFAESDGFHLVLVTVPSGYGPHRTSVRVADLPTAVRTMRAWVDTLLGTEV